MKNPISRLAHTSTRGIACLALVGGLITGAPMLAAGGADHDHPAPAKLVQIVREATRQFIDVNNAGPMGGYGPAFGCVSGPDHGAMGIHYVNGALVMDGLIDAAHPEALIYEPVGNRRRLVGVEYIVDAKDVAGQPRRPAGARGPAVPVRERPEPLQPRSLFRAARVGVARESQRRLRRLEQQRELRRTVTDKQCSMFNAQCSMLRVVISCI